ncbi:DUF4232 domain-containing protein [Streptomyces cylindrosporus]|uniref:DUF4232 domain-containing protein n=1 Tax=Streptomyces cylindrosporus TaxID=2927583 RepID=A0ABS9YCH0_9ACTN|nr:DUF4232 domain-containing protein [Streptomyces cylindrosporus]MCI3274923.1 DUF4232 domain-containing protein [Streptomyces cylindrosporus]
MRKHRIRTATLAATTLLAALSLTACNGLDDNASPASTSGSSSASAENTSGTKDTGTNGAGTGGTQGKGTATGGSSSGSTTGSSTTKSSTTGSSSSGGSGDKSGYGQSCGTNDLTWSSRSETQAGGYILVMVKAKPGITCVLPGSLPVVAFGSDGTQASNAEQVVGQELTLSGSTTAYAGVNPKTTNNDDGKELTSIIVSVTDNDPHPVSLKTGTITVDKPIVTNWHTSAADAVPGDGTDS